MLINPDFDLNVGLIVVKEVLLVFEHIKIMLMIYTSIKIHPPLTVAPNISNCEQNHEIFDSTTDGTLPYDENVSIPISEFTTPETMQKFSARFILGLKEKHKIPQVVMQHIIEEVTSLNQIRSHSLNSEVRAD